MSLDQKLTNISFEQQIHVKGKENMRTHGMTLALLVLHIALMEVEAYKYEPKF